MVRRRRFPATLESLPVVRDFVQQEASRAGLSDARQLVLELVLEELVVNIVSYAYVCPLNDTAGETSTSPQVVPVETSSDSSYVEVLCGSGEDAPDMHTPMARAISSAGIQPEDLFCVVLVDSGIAFDPLSVSSPNHLDQGVEERQCGGLGIHFARERASVMAYERNADKNRLGFAILLQ